VALPLVGWLVDRIGRRASIAFGAAWTLVGAILQGSAKHVAPFIIARFLIGWGLAFTVVGAPLLLAELALPKHRGTVLSYFPTAWYIGAIIAAWTTYGTQHIENSWSWRTPSILQGVPAVIQLLLIWLVPESPRWLISKGSGAKARQILVKYHANGDEQSPIVDIEYSQIKEAILQDTRVKKEGSYLDLVRSKPNRRRLIIVTFCGLFLEASLSYPESAMCLKLTLNRSLATDLSNTTYIRSLTALASPKLFSKQQSTVAYRYTTLFSRWLRRCSWRRSADEGCS